MKLKKPLWLMPLTINNLNSIEMKRILMIALLALTWQIRAQEKVKIDGVATVVGDNIVLDSEIDAFKEELIQQSGGQIEITDCEMLEQIMNRKLLAHHAVIDSIVVNEGEIQQQVKRKTDYFTQQLGSTEKMLELYGFDNIIKCLFIAVKAWRKTAFIAYCSGKPF